MTGHDKKIESNNSPRERGAVIVEAAIALPVFLFAMITLYSIIQMAYVQARMSTALNCAAKELAEYSHVFYATGLNDVFSGSGGASSELANQVSEFLTTVGGELGPIDSGLGQYVNDAGQAISGDSLVDLAKYKLGQTLAEQMMRKNMVTGSGDSPEAFMHRNRITNFNMDGSNFLEENSKKIFMRANYDIEVIKLLNIDITFHMSSCAYTEAWGGE